MRRAIIVVLTLALLLPVGLLAQGAAADPVDVPGLEGPARVDRDGNGIAHIRAGTRHDLFFLQGWVHAQDRLFQMDVRRRQAEGTLAELLGPAALPTDVQLRTIGLHRAAARSLPALSGDARAVLAAYADGVNAWVADNPLPPEYGALTLTWVRPWTALDSVAVGKLQAFGLSFDLDIELTTALLGYQQAGQAGGFDGSALFFQDLWRSEPFTDASTVPDASRGGRRHGPPAGRAARAAGPAGERLAAGRLAERYAAVAAKVPLLRQALSHDRGQTGSNQWAVSGRVAAGGHPLLANDPHLALDSPSTFYPVHLQAGETDAIGSGFAGTPGVIVGNNRFISWGATVNPMDVTDTYAEQVRPDPSSPSGLATLYQGQLEPVIPIPETFRQNNPGSGSPDNLTVVPPGGAIPPATLIVPRRNNGPIIQLDQQRGTALSVQYTGFSATRELETFLIWDDARNLDDFRRGLERFDVGGQNWAYADVEGNIAYFTSAELPLREDLQAGTVNGLPPFFIRDGTGGNEWLPVQNPQPGQAIPYEILPYQEMPQVLNPPAGFFVNANNDPAGVTLDNDPLNQARPGGGIYYLNNGYAGIRAGRITALLRAELAGGGTRVVRRHAAHPGRHGPGRRPVLRPPPGQGAGQGGAGQRPDPARAGPRPGRGRGGRPPRPLEPAHPDRHRRGLRRRRQRRPAAAPDPPGAGQQRGRHHLRGLAQPGHQGRHRRPAGPLRGAGARRRAVPDRPQAPAGDLRRDPGGRRLGDRLLRRRRGRRRRRPPRRDPAPGGQGRPGQAGRPRLPGRLRRVDRPGRLPLGPPAPGDHGPSPRRAVQHPAGLRRLPAAPGRPARHPDRRRLRDGRRLAPTTPAPTPQVSSGSAAARPTATSARPGAPATSGPASSLPGGTSGVPGTPFYVNLLPGWLTNDTFQLEQGAAG